MILMNVLGLTLDAANKSPILVLRQTNAQEGAEAQILPIWLGVSEAMSLSMALNRVQLRRPLPHDLLLVATQALGGRISGVTLTDLREGTFYAQVDIAHGDTFTQLDCRPSDAVLLALRTGSDIRVTQRVLDAAVEGRIRPNASEMERRPLDSAEEIIREAGLKLLSESDAPDAPGLPPELKASLDSAALFAARKGPDGEASGMVAEGLSNGGDEEKLAEFLRRIEPASRRVM